MSERPPTTMVRGSESDTPHLRVEMPRDVYKRLVSAERQVAAVREVLALLDERVEILRRPGDPSLAAYFEGRAAGEMAGTQQAADAIRRALETANTAEAGGDEG